MRDAAGPADIDRGAGAEGAARSPVDRVARPAGWLRVPLVCLAGLIVLWVVAVQTRIGQRLDDAAIVHHHFDRTREPDLPTAQRLLTLSTLVLGPVVLWFGRNRLRSLLVYGCAAAGAVLVAEVTREVLPRALFGPANPSYGPSYPSGHATAAMALALALVVLSPETPLQRLVVPVVPAVAAVMTLAIPIHRTSDLIAGFVLALAVMTAAHRVDPGSSLAVRDPPVRRWRAATARIIVLSGLLLVAESLALRHAHLALGDLGPGFPVALVAVVVSSELTVAAFRGSMARR